MKNLAAEIILTQLKAAHGVLEQTMDGVTDEVAHFMPSGKANPIAGTYAHVVFSEDLFIHSFLKKESPLFETVFKNKTGASEVQPSEWVEAYPKWLKDVKIDVDKFREYAKAVYKASEDHLMALTEKELEQEIDLSVFGMPQTKVFDFISNLISGHVYSIAGEISVLKGIQGLKGYPF